MLLIQTEIMPAILAPAPRQVNAEGLLWEVNKRWRASKTQAR